MKDARWLLGSSARRTALASLVGGLLVAGCTLEDIGKSIVAGTLDFVYSYTIDVLYALFPDPGSLTDPAGGGG
jgi:hypothetical protein